MLPVVRGEDETARQIVLYTVALVTFTLAPAPGASSGLVYLVAAVALGGAFLWLALAAAARANAGPRGAPLPLLARVPRAALRRDGPGRGDRVSQEERSRTSTSIITAEYLPREVAPEEERSNALFGLALFAVSLLLFAGTVGLAFVYLWLD